MRNDKERGRRAQRLASTKKLAGTLHSAASSDPKSHSFSTHPQSGEGWVEKLVKDGTSDQKSASKGSQGAGNEPQGSRQRPGQRRRGARVSGETRMAKRFETFEEAHVRALRAVREELEARLSRGLDDDQFWFIAKAYPEAMGYEVEEEDDMGNDPQSKGARWCRSVKQAWTRGLKSGGAYRLTLGELVERCIRAGIVTIGERWPGDKESPRATHSPRKLRAA